LRYVLEFLTSKDTLVVKEIFRCSGASSQKKTFKVILKGHWTPVLVTMATISRNTTNGKTHHLILTLT